MIKYDIASKPIIANTASKPGNLHFPSGVGEAAGEAAGVREGEGDNAGEGVTVIAGVGVSNEVTGK